ncbi:Retron-type reverse transcriptase [Bacteroidales bacterium Barb6XT]|nr:Retron-type reverse transcriptase [Bacteroidales bacterium Barb6XT]
MLKSKIKDVRMLNTLSRILESYKPPTGIPTGYHSSQLLGNFYLSGLDLHAKNELKVRYCFRYCDDIVILSASKEELHLLFEHIKEFAEERLHLTIKDNHQIFPIESRGIDFFWLCNKVRLYTCP